MQPAPLIVQACTHTAACTFHGRAVDRVDISNQRTARMPGPGNRPDADRHLTGGAETPMKVTDLTLDIVEREVPSVRIQDHRGAIGGKLRNAILRIRTEDGLEGHCTVGDRGGNSDPLFERIMRDLKPRVVGMEVGEREKLWSDLERIGGHGAPVHAAWSCVDVALWDLAGKAAGEPVHRLLGTARYDTPVYATYPPRHASPEGFVEEAQELKSQGFSAYKIHPGAMGTRDAVRMVGTVREAVGDQMELMLDPNNGYGFRKAFEIGRALDDNGFFWFEDPVLWNDFDSIRELSARLRTPLNMSDTAAFLFREAAHYVRLGYPRLVRGTTRKLGITGLKKLCGLLEGFGMNCEIGLAGNSLLNAANLHVIMSVTNCDYYEYWMPLAAHQWGVVDDIKLNERGTIDAPMKPGLGFNLDEEWIAAHKVTTLS
jgi:L-alanine-DL-glutamate epimerase-like enolase superfamily enzyme